MDDRFYDDLEIALSSYSIRSTDDYNEEDEEKEGEYDGEEVNDVGIEDKSEEMACPFCLEDFDVLGLCCHIDADHRMEVKPGICPVCATNVPINMASHVITQHESILKALSNQNHRCARACSSVYPQRKELQEKHLRSVKESPGILVLPLMQQLILCFCHLSIVLNQLTLLKPQKPLLHVKQAYQENVASMSVMRGMTRLPQGLSWFRDCFYLPFLTTCETA